MVLTSALDALLRVCQGRPAVNDYAGVMMETLVPKNLVRWRMADGGEALGMVTAVNASRVSARFDGDPEIKQFAVSSGALDRVVLQDGQQVRLLASDVQGVIQARLDHQGLLLYRVGLPDGQNPTVSEDGLRPVVLTDPIARLRVGELHSARLTNLRLAAHRMATANRNEELASLSNSRVELKPHQVGVVHRVASSYPHRFVLADEVGLGKTIEAGLLIRELLARGVAKRILIVAPSGLVGQWQQELKSKFNLSFSRYTGEVVRVLGAEHPDENVWGVRDLVVTSETFASWTEERWKEIAGAGWDMVVVDEAHHVRRRYDGPNKSSATRLYRMMQELSDPDLTQGQAMLLLTATPMQLHPFELYSLIELLDPALFPSFAEFEAHRRAVSGLNTTVERVKRWPSLSEDARAGAVGELRKWLNEPGAEASLETVEGRSRVVDELESRHRLSQVMVRNRKRVVGGFMPRRAAIWEVHPTTREQEAYAVLERYLRTGFQRSRMTENNALGFLMSTFGKLGASSTRALKGSLERRIQKLESVTDDERKADIVDAASLEELPTVDALDDLLAQKADLDWEEIRELEEIVELLEASETDSKGRLLVENLAAMATEQADLKVIIFTQFRDTQDYIGELLADRWSVHLFHGSLKPQEKDLAVAQFRDGTGPQVLISTEAGGEGRNFQFCSVLVNYDLPWNPMRVEQRIGRVDRIGQTEPVKIFNLATVGTIEERVVEILTQRIGVFTETIGGLDPILGEVEKDIAKVFLAAEHERDRAMAEMGDTLEQRIAEARQTETRLADLIMDTRSYAREEVEQLLGRDAAITAHDVRAFVLGALADLGVGIQKDEARPGVYDLTLGSHFEQVFPEEYRAGSRRAVTFDRSVALQLEEVEFMAFGHDIVDVLVTRLANREHGGITSVRAVLSDERPAARGWFFAYELEYRGLETVGRLFPVFMHEDGSSDPELAQWLLDRAMTGRMEDSPGVSLPECGPEFDDLVQSVGQLVVTTLFEQQAALEAGNDERLSAERRKQETFFDYRRQAAADKVVATERTVQRLRESVEDADRKILPVWEKNLQTARTVAASVDTDRRARLEELEGREHVTAQHQLLTASFVAVGPEPAALLERVAEQLTPSMFKSFRALCARASADELQAKEAALAKRRAALRQLAQKHSFDVDLAVGIADALIGALADVERLGIGERQLLNGAIEYFLLLEDEDHDLKDPKGFEDDRAVLNIVLEAVGRRELVVGR